MRDGKKIDQARFLIQASLQFYYEFDVKLKRILEQLGEPWVLKITLKEDLHGISERIQQYIDEDLARKNRGGGSLDRAEKKRQKRTPGWFHIRDMIKATLHVNSIKEIWGAYEWFANSDFFRVL